MGREEGEPNSLPCCFLSVLMKVSQKCATSIGLPLSPSNPPGKERVIICAEEVAQHKSEVWEETPALADHKHVRSG